MKYIAFRIPFVLALLLGSTEMSEAAGLEILHDFVTSGTFPEAKAIEASDGNLYGTTRFGGGLNNGGTVYKVAKDGSGFALLKSFVCLVDGCEPTAGLIEGSDGNLYGTTQSGGDFNNGTIFKLAKDGSGFTLLKSFSCATADGCNPTAGLIEGSDGNLYGTTLQGGASGQGTVFKIAKDGSGFAPVKSFACSAAEGCAPFAGLIEGSDGNLYGTTLQGGASAGGTVFKIAKNGSGFALLKSFDCGTADGCVPAAGLVEGSDGNLYGTTQQGGTPGATMFKLAKDGSGFAVLKSFACGPDDGCTPFGDLIEGTDGNLYGTTQQGGASDGGTVFKIAKNGSGFALLKSFNCGVADGCSPSDGLIESSDGNLYGTTNQGGTSSTGTVFKMAKDGSDFALLKSFGCDAADGCFPFAGLIEGSDGDLYGTTNQGGASGGGTIFKIAKDGSGFTLLKGFDCGSTACNPTAALVEGSDGNLYGTTQFDSGTVFKIAKDGSDFTVLKTFACNAADGCRPAAGLIEGSDGNLYGMTQLGGGAVFKIAKDGSGFALLKSFTCGALPGDGCFPTAALVEGSDGNLYGTTQQGGASAAGTVFKIAKDGSGFTLLKTFSCATLDGCLPTAGLVEGSDGNLYGTNEGGGASNGGTLFKIAKDGSGFAVLKSFTCGAIPNDGCFPTATLIEGSDGHLYGTTETGGFFNDGGTLFTIARDGSEFRVLNSFFFDGFNCFDGCTPVGGVIEGSDGKLYGTTLQGGDFGVGVIYQLLPNKTQTIAVTQDAPASAVFDTSFNVAATGGGSGNSVVIAASGACSGDGINSATVTMTSGTGDCTVTFDQAGGADFDAAPTVTQTVTAAKATPSITWNNPADIFWGAALTDAQLNATANADGTFNYTPAAGTVLAVGNGQALSTSFTPAATNDYAGAGASVSINVLPPDTEFTSVPPAQTKLKTASFSFTSTMSGGPFECKLDGAAFAPCTSPSSYTKLAKGSHTFQVRATDGLGHPDPTPASYTWIAAAPAPKTSIVSAPSSPTTNQSAQFTFASNQANGIFECSLDNSAFVLCSSPKSYFGLSIGKHAFKVRSTNTAGDIGSPANFKWVVD